MRERTWNEVTRPPHWQTRVERVSWQALASLGCIAEAEARVLADRVNEQLRRERIEELATN